MPNKPPGIGRIAGGQVCPACDTRVGIIDSYCRYCGECLE